MKAKTSSAYEHKATEKVLELDDKIAEIQKDQPLTGGETFELGQAIQSLQGRLN